MSLFETLRYHWMTHGVGAAALRLDRHKLEKKLRIPREDPHLGPPVQTSAWLKELISRHYLKGRYAEGVRPVAWVTSGAPSEFLVALGYHLHYPENHGAVCGIRRTAESACEVAEEAGWSRDVCSYARTDIGTVRSGVTPVGKLPRPDLLVCCTNICQTVLYWYQVLAREFDVPLVVIDTPFLYADAPEHAVAYVRAQVAQAIEVAERVAGRSMDPRALERTTRHAQQATRLWMEVLEEGRHRPTSFTAFDAFIHLAPIVEMRGEPYTVDYYAALLDALRQRREQGVAAVKEERIRLVWDNLPIWPRMRWLSGKLAERGAALVASTYTQAWGELYPLIDPASPVDSAARVYLHPILNRGTGHKLRTMQKMVEDYEAQGVILHSDRSCKPYSIGQVDQQQQLGVPALLLEADHNDPRAFAEDQAETRIEAFLEVIES